MNVDDKNFDSLTKLLIQNGNFVNEITLFIGVILTTFSIFIFVYIIYTTM